MNFQIEAKLGAGKHNLEGVIITVKREGTGQGGVRSQPWQLQGLQRSIWATERSSSLTCPVRSFSDSKKTEAMSASSLTGWGRGGLSQNSSIQSRRQDSQDNCFGEDDS